MPTRICTACKKIKPLSAFHKCNGFKHGVYTKCKDCRRIITSEDYKKRKKEIQKQVRKYRNTIKGRRARQNENSNLRNKFPLKYKAAYLMNNAVRDGRLVRLPCEKCGGKAQGHHPDYTKPLLVMWLCKDHHFEWHQNNKAYYPGD
jgi:hypothetical protein